MVSEDNTVIHNILPSIVLTGMLHGSCDNSHTMIHIWNKVESRQEVRLVYNTNNNNNNNNNINNIK